MVVQGNDRSLRPSISRCIRHIQRNVKIYRKGMVLSLFFCKQVWIQACEPLTLTKPITIVLFADWSVNTYNTRFHHYEHEHVFVVVYQQLCCVEEALTIVLYMNE